MRRRLPGDEAFPAAQAAKTLRGEEVPVNRRGFKAWVRRMYSDAGARIGTSLAPKAPGCPRRALAQFAGTTATFAGG